MWKPTMPIWRRNNVLAFDILSQWDLLCTTRIFCIITFVCVSQLQALNQYKKKISSSRSWYLLSYWYSSYSSNTCVRWIMELPWHLFIRTMNESKLITKWILISNERNRSARWRENAHRFKIVLHNCIKCPPRFR